MFKFVLNIVVFLSAMTAMGQELFTVTGIIQDENGETIPHALITIASINKSSVSDPSGYYSLAGIPAGAHQLVIQSVGFTPMTVNIDVSDQTSTFNVVLQESVQELDVVTVQGKSEARETVERAYAVTAISTQAFNNRSIDINQILNQSTGVRIREAGGMGSRFNFMLNGLSGKQVKFFVDGIPMDYLGDAFQLNNVPPNLINRVEVYKGVVPVELGSDALGGAVNIVTNLHARPYLDASYSYGSFNTHRAALSALVRKDTTGLFLRFNGFLNRSDNNYMMNDMEVELPESGQLVKKDVRRFHDDYFSYMGQIEAGIANKRWADVFLIGVATGGVKRDVQNDIHAVVIGEATSEEKNDQLSVRFENSKLLSGKMNLQFHAQYNKLNSISVDSSSNRYNWDGTIKPWRVNDGFGELLREKTVFDYNQSYLVYRLGLGYSFLTNHKLKANVVGSDVSRQGVNRLKPRDVHAFSEPNTLNKIVSGLSLESEWFKGKLSTMAAVKNFAFNMFARNVKVEQVTQYSVEDVSTSWNRYGFAMAARYFITPDVLVKTSFEKAYRLPEASEAMGDGLQIAAAPFLQPESSINFNAGFQYRKMVARNLFTVESNLFRREVENYIYLQSLGKVSAYKNEMKVLVRGVEVDARYTYNDQLTAFVNLTYQDVLNNDRYQTGSNGTKENTFYRDRLPNTPYFLSNAGVSYSMNDVARGYALALFYSASYVHEFYLTYSRAARNNKNSIPSQLVNNAGITLSSPDRRYHVSMEVRNLLDEKVFDNFNLQRPGRSLSVKIRYFIQH